MELLKAIKERRSIRKFTPQPVDHAQLETLIKESLWAPSGMNRQVWKFFVLEGQSLQNFQDKFSTRATENIDTDLKDLFNDKMRNFIKGYFKNLGGAKTAVICMSKASDGYVEDHANMLSAAAAFYNLLLLAHEAGLATCWMTGYSALDKEMAEFLGCPGWKLAGVTPIGYPDQTPPVPPRKHETIIWME